MRGILIEQSYKYENLTLSNGEIINCSSVTLKKGKVVHSNNVNVKVNENDGFSFQLRNNNDGSPKADIYGVPAGIDAQAIINEFIVVVEADITQ